MNADTKDLRQLDQSHHLHPFTDLGAYSQKGGRIISKAEHIYIYDSDGNKILDGMSGLWCCNLGYSQNTIAEAVYAQMQELPVIDKKGHVLADLNCFELIAGLQEQQKAA